MHTLKRLLAPVVLLVPLASACAHADAIPVQGPDGQPGWYAVSCKKNHANCLEAAGESCPAGYDVASQEGRSGTAVNGNVSPWGAGFAARPTYHGDMLIKCHAPGAIAARPAPAPNP